VIREWTGQVERVHSSYFGFFVVVDEEVLEVVVEASEGLVVVDVAAGSSGEVAS
jgi:hypothetical protein